MARLVAGQQDGLEDDPARYPCNLKLIFVNRGYLTGNLSPAHSELVMTGIPVFVAHSLKSEREARESRCDYGHEFSETSNARNCHVIAPL